MEKQVKNIIIGFGKAGKTLAGLLATKGESTVLIEKSKAMYGGTCINVGCIPSKKLSVLAEQRQFSALSDEEYFDQAVSGKKALISALNQANYNKAVGAGVEVIDGEASFIDDHTVLVKQEAGEIKINAERIFINTGTTSFVPPIKGLTLGKKVHTSETFMDLTELPKELLIVGGGFIGLEFASTFNNFGSNVTVLNNVDDILLTEDADVREAVKANYEAMGVTVTSQVNILEFIETDDDLVVKYELHGEVKEQRFDAALISTGRMATTKALNLENAGVEVNERGFIKVNKHLQTNVDHIFAMGDVNGGLQFTYISLDDFRIVKSFLFEEGQYTLEDRKNIPTSAFIYPTLSRVGITEQQAVKEGYEVKTAVLPVNAIPKAKVLNHQVGLYKAVVDAKTDKILGVTLYAPESHEVINIITTAINAGVKYQQLRDQVYTHPTMAEALNDLFGMIR